MPLLSGYPTGSHTATSVVDTEQKLPIGTRQRDKNGNEYVYLKGVASTLAGSWVTFDEAGTTTLLAANAIGPVAVAQAAIDATTEYGWYCVYGSTSALLAANCADNAKVGRETTDGYAGDGRAAGDEIYGAISRGSTAGASALTSVQINYPYVDDANGA
jgi:hypothetical protein